MKNLLSLGVALIVGTAGAATTGIVPEDGAYRFTFGTDAAADGFAVPPSAVYDAQTSYANTPGGTFTYGFLGTTDASYKNDTPWSLPSVPHAIDGFKVVQGQSIRLREIPGKGVAGPLKADYLPAGASAYEGRYPVRFSMSAEPNAYYAVTCTVVNVSSTATADVTLFSERCHIQAHHLTLAPDETRTFAWSVELAPNVFKSSGTYIDDAINVVVVGENAGLQSLVVVKQPQVAGTVRGVATDRMNVGKTMWLCDDSTGTDQRNDTPYFSLQNYSGVGSGLSRYAPASLAIRNQGEGGLATNAGSHRRSCLLKEGDYLYVEYGHNEGSVESYTNNLELYLADATAAKANLIIVSPVERRSSWNGETETWNRSLAKISLGGEAWVEDKIAQGATNIAFIDLNTRYNDWMNAEIRRIHAAHPEIPLTAAISYYYRSAKGAHVDNTHINNAGTDQAAYWVWYDALARVAAGEREDATENERVQAAVLKGITDGYQGTVGLESTDENLPWSVTDDIINAGLAPNTFWDMPVTEGFEYVNEAAVASIDATSNADGSVTVSGVTMRILNPGNYYKAVIETVSADGVTTNRYFSYYNYDVGGAGKASGDLVTPEQPGFLAADKAKDEVVAADCTAVTVSAGGSATVWFAEADAGTWQIGENAPCSAKVPVAWAASMVVDDDCSDAAAWKVLTQAVSTTNVTDGALAFSSTGADAGNTKKNFGLYRALDSAITHGRYRLSFKALIEAGTIDFRLGDAVNSTTMLFKNDVSVLKLTTDGVTGYQGLAPAITVATEEDGSTTPQAKVNPGQWIDIDLIVDRDNGKAALSVGGSDYVTWEDPDVIPGAFAGQTWKYFGITTPGQTSTYGAIDELKIEKLASVVSDETGPYRVLTWDFSAYQGEGEIAGTATTVSEQGLEFHLTADDALTGAGLRWKNSANSGTGSSLAAKYAKYIVYTPEESGRLTLRFAVDAYNDSRKPTLVVNVGDEVSACVNDANKFALVQATSAGTEYTLSVDLEAGTTYYIWPYAYNWSGANYQHTYTIASIAYSYLPTNRRVFHVAAETTETCAESLTGSLNVMKTGEGVLDFAGDNSFEGKIEIAEGTLRLASPLATAGEVIAHYEGEVLAAPPFVTPVSVTRPQHTFLVWRPSGVEKNYYKAMGDTSNEKWCVRKRGQNDTTWQVLKYDVWTSPILVNGGANVAKSGLQLLEVTTGEWARYEKGKLFFGTANDEGLDEVVLYAAQLAEADQKRVEDYLMAKWGIAEASYTQLPAGATVDVAAGATLDVGERPGVTLTGLTLAKGAVVAVDAIKVGEVLATAATIENAGAILRVGGESTPLRLRVIDNGDGTQSLKVVRPGLQVIFS